jgi:hypothetical protein
MVLSAVYFLMIGHPGFVFKSDKTLTQTSDTEIATKNERGSD